MAGRYERIKPRLEKQHA